MAEPTRQAGRALGRRCRRLPALLQPEQITGFTAGFRDFLWGV